MNRKTESRLIHGIAPYKPAAKEAYMSEKQVAHFRAILTAWRAELSSDTSKTVAHIQDETANHPDPADRASQETDMALELRGRDRDRKLLRRIDETIAQLVSGDYGYCDNCGEEIGLRRLEARPTAVLCIECKKLDEIREKQVL